MERRVMQDKLVQAHLAERDRDGHSNSVRMDLLDLDSKAEEVKQQLGAFQQGHFSSSLSPQLQNLQTNVEQLAQNWEDISDLPSIKYARKRSAPNFAYIGPREMNIHSERIVSTLAGVSAVGRLLAKAMEVEDSEAELSRINQDLQTILEYASARKGAEEKWLPFSQENNTLPEATKLNDTHLAYKMWAVRVEMGTQVGSEFSDAKGLSTNQFYPPLLDGMESFKNAKTDDDLRLALVFLRTERDLVDSINEKVEQFIISELNPSTFPLSQAALNEFNGKAKNISDALITAQKRGRDEIEYTPDFINRMTRDLKSARENAEKNFTAFKSCVEFVKAAPVFQSTIISVNVLLSCLPADSAIRRTIAQSRDEAQEAVKKVNYDNYLGLDQDPIIQQAILGIRQLQEDIELYKVPIQNVQQAQADLVTGTNRLAGSVVGGGTVGFGFFIAASVFAFTGPIGLALLGVGLAVIGVSIVFGAKSLFDRDNAEGRLIENKRSIVTLSIEGRAYPSVPEKPPSSPSYPQDTSNLTKKNLEQSQGKTLGAQQQEVGEKSHNRPFS